MNKKKKKKKVGFLDFNERASFFWFWFCFSPVAFDDARLPRRLWRRIFFFFVFRVRFCCCFGCEFLFCLFVFDVVAFFFRSRFAAAAAAAAADDDHHLRRDRVVTAGFLLSPVADGRRPPRPEDRGEDIPELLRRVPRDEPGGDAGGGDASGSPGASAAGFGLAGSACCCSS
jgi:hypothetical protein